MDLVVVGPMARSVADLILAFDILAGPDENELGIGYTLNLPRAHQKQLSDFRVLVLDEHPLFPTAQSVSQSLNLLVDRLSEQGVTITRQLKELPDLAAITRNYVSMLWSFGVADMPIEKYQELEQAHQHLANDDLSLPACGIRGTVASHRDWLLLLRKRWQLRQQWRQLYQKFDVILCPVMPITAFKHDHSPNQMQRQIEINDAKFPYQAQLIWINMATLFGLPATVVPIEPVASRLPIGVQIIGDYLADYTTLTFGKLLQEKLGGFVAPPDYLV